MDIDTTLRMIFERSPAAQAAAAECIQAIEVDVALGEIARLYAIVANQALDDPKADWTPAERVEIASHLHVKPVRDATVIVRMTGAEKAQLRAEAAAAGMKKLSEYARLRLIGPR